MILFGIDKVTKYHMDVPLLRHVFTYWAMNKAKYDAMSPAQKKVIDDHCTTEWAEKVASPWADFETCRPRQDAGRAGPRGLHADARPGGGVAQGGRAAAGAVGRAVAKAAATPTRCYERVAGRARKNGAGAVIAVQRPGGVGAISDQRSVMDRFIDRIEALAALFVGIVAADIFISVLLRDFFAVPIPDSLRFRQHAAGHPDLLGHRRDLLSRHPYHGRPGVGRGRPARQAA